MMHLGYQIGPTLLSRHSPPMPLGQPVNLRPVKAGAEQSKLVGCEEDAVRVSPNVRIVTIAKPTGATMVGGAVGAIVLNRDPVDRVWAKRTRRLANRQVKMIGSGEVAGRRVDFECQHDDEPALRVYVEIAARVGDEWALQPRG